MSTVPALAANPGGPSQSKKPPVWVNDTGFTTLAEPLCDPVADVVFVHGLQGHPRRTWRFKGTVVEREPVAEATSTKRTLGIFRKKAPKWGERRVQASVFWPLDLLPEDRNDVRLMTYGYDSHITKGFGGPASQATISDHGRSFLHSLTSQRLDCGGRPLIFVAHSLGGLIVKEALRRSREERNFEDFKDVYRSTFATIFFGTPHRGSGDAGWAEILRRIASAAQLDTTKTILSDLDPSSGSAKLDELSEAFSDMLDERGFMVYSFQESQGKAGLKPLRQQVVPKESSALNIRRYEIKQDINANHMGMCKFSGRDDDGYKKFLAALNFYIRDILTKKSQAMEASAKSHGQPLTRPTDMILHGDAERPDRPGFQQEKEGSQQGAQFIVPYLSNPNFVGRSDILETMKNYFELDYQRTFQPRAALFGLGGIGKTQIAIAYAYWVRERYPNVSVFWVHASNPERFHQAFAQIAQECQIPQHDPHADTTKLVKDWLGRKDQHPWLMIIDNADETEIFFSSYKATSQPSQGTNQITSTKNLASYIPECSHGSILVTTRNKQTGVKLVRNGRLIEVEEMNETESVELILQRLQDDVSDRDQVTLLAARLENLPLALGQAAAFIQENSLSINGYLQLLDKSDDLLVELLSQPFEEVGRDSSIPNAVTATWMISFEQIRRRYPLANNLLWLICFFDRQGIPEAFLSHYYEEHYDQDCQHSQEFEEEGMIELEKALGILRAFSFISEGKRGGTFDMHRLIQLVIRKWLLREGISTEWTNMALSVVSDLYPPGCHDNREKCQEYLPHAFAILRHLESCPVTETLTQGGLLYNTARFLNYRGEWNNAEILQLQAVEVMRKVLGEEHPDTLLNKSELALIYLNQGRWKEAEELEVQIMKTRKRVLEEEHPNILTSIANLALTYWNQGRWKEAEELGVQVIETRKRVSGEEHPDTLTSIANLASTYSSQGRWKEAEELEMQVMETRKRVLGEKHPDILISMANLASTYSSQGRWKEAEELEMQVMETRKRVLGEKHPDTLTSMANLALTYSNQGRWKKAEELKMQVMETRKRVLGEEHPDTLTSMANLALTYWNQGRWKEAEELEMQVMETRKRVLGEEHPSTLMSMANLASTYWDQGRWKEAEELGVQVMETRKRVLGKEHPETLRTMSNLAHTWKSQGRDTEAVELMASCCELSNKKLGDDHPDSQYRQETLNDWLEDSEWSDVDNSYFFPRRKAGAIGQQHPQHGRGRHLFAM